MDASNKRSDDVWVVGFVHSTVDELQPPRRFFQVLLFLPVGSMLSMKGPSGIESIQADFYIIAQRDQ